MHYACAGVQCSWVCVSLFPDPAPLEGTRLGVCVCMWHEYEETIMVWLLELLHINVTQYNGSLLIQVSGLYKASMCVVYIIMHMAL